MFTEKQNEAQFLNMTRNAYGIYLFEHLVDSRAVRQNYKLAWYKALHPFDTLENIYARFTSERKYSNLLQRSNGVPFGPGDVIAIKEGGILTAWYVDMLAFSKLPGFFDGAGGKEGVTRAG